MNGINTRQEKVTIVIAHIIMILLAVLAIAPFWLLVSSSLQEESSILEEGYSFLPKHMSTAAYSYIGKEWTQIGRAFLVTIITTVVGTALSLILVSMTSYALSIKGLPGGTVIFILIVFTMLFNGGAVATYITYSNVLDVRDTIFALIIPNLLLNGFNVMLVRSYVSNSIPAELQEAAMIDGAGLFRIYWKIVLPLSVPILATVGLLTALGYWNDWVNGLYFISNPKLNSIQLLLNNINNSAQFLASHSELKIPRDEIPTVGIRMAISVIAILPILIIYPFFQKYFVGGITLGAVKG